MKTNQSRAKSKKQSDVPTDDQKHKVKQLVEKMKGTFNIFIGNSDNLIAELHDFKVNNMGFKVLGIKRWGEFFDKHIPQSTYSKTSHYHFGEIVDFFDTHNITPGNETTPSVRAICSIRKKDREQIWQDCIVLSDREIPSPELIKEEATLKNSGQKANRKSAKQIMQVINERSNTELVQLLTEIQGIIEAHRSDELGVRSISIDELQKLEALITDKVKNQSE